MLIPSSALMYNHRSEKHRVDVVDLDPYGTAAPFIDPAVQCINDGGLAYSTVSRRDVIDVMRRLQTQGFYASLALIWQCWRLRIIPKKGAY